jgi:hypothetical protein
MTKFRQEPERNLLLLPPASCEKINFRLSGWDRPGFTLVEVDVAKLDQDWRNSGEGYIAPDGTGATEGRLERFAAWLSAHAGEQVYAPSIYLNRRNHVAFADGRHRFALLRNRGYRLVKVASEKSKSR